MNSKTSKAIFLGFLILNILVALFFGLLPLVSFTSVLELNQISYSEELVIFGVVMGTAMLFLTAILILSFLWTRKGKREGAIIGIFAGFYLLVVGILSWIYTGDSTTFMMDSIRGFITILFGLMVYRSLKSSSNDK